MLRGDTGPPQTTLERALGPRRAPRACEEVLIQALTQQRTSSLITRGAPGRGAAPARGCARRGRERQDSRRLRTCLLNNLAVLLERSSSTAECVELHRRGGGAGAAASETARTESRHVGGAGRSRSAELGRWEESSWPRGSRGRRSSRPAAGAVPSCIDVASRSTASGARLDAAQALRRATLGLAVPRPNRPTWPSIVGRSRRVPPARPGPVRRGARRRRARACPPRRSSVMTETGRSSAASSEAIEAALDSRRSRQGRRVARYRSRTLQPGRAHSRPCEGQRARFRARLDAAREGDHASVAARLPHRRSRPRRARARLLSPPLTQTRARRVAHRPRRDPDDEIRCWPRRAKRSRASKPTPWLERLQLAGAAALEKMPA